MTIRFIYSKLKVGRYYINPWALKGKKEAHDMRIVNVNSPEFRLAEIIWEKEPISTEELVKIAILELLWDGATTQKALRKLCRERIMQEQNGMVTSKISYEDYCARLREWNGFSKSEARIGFLGASDRFWGGNDRRF